MSCLERQQTIHQSNCSVSRRCAVDTTMGSREPDAECELYSRIGMPTSPINTFFLAVLREIDAFSLDDV